MAFYFEEPSRTFSEYLLIPGYSSTQCIPSQVNLKTPLVKYKKGTEPDITINIPMVSAIMQSVSDGGYTKFEVNFIDQPDMIEYLNAEMSAEDFHRMAVALAQEGGISFIYGSQAIEKQAEMIHKVKRYRAGFVVSDSNVSPDMTLADVLAITEETGHSTIAVTADGQPNGKLLGIVTNKDYRVSRMGPDTKVKDFMTTLDNLVYADESTTLKEANDIIWEHKINCLPLVNKNQELVYLVFRKDYDTHKKKLDAGADVLCIDSSEGFSEWQKITIDYIRKNFGDSVKVGAGNVVDGDGFRFLAEAGADFVKVGIGGGAICITREQKGIGRGQATALIEVAKARDEYYKETGVYVPICSDGGIVHDYHITLALAMGADFIMLGRYFARFDESPTKRVNVNGSYMKEYWGEGSARARNWQRYDMGGDKKLSFEEGVDSFVPYAGSLKDNVNLTLSKVRSTMCNCGALTIPELQEKAKITLVSSTSIVEGGAHDVMLRDKR